jgi:pyruvate ferredoxin oxidoreductase alpha subunit
MKFISGNDAVAQAVRLCRPHVISAYPITPQTIVVERLSEFVEDGSLKANFMHVESEHSAMACAIGVSSVGARAFTATSSQGLLYMAETLPYASGARLPIVMMNANRAIATPWNIYGDQMDVMFLLNSGWIQIFVEDAQEALDMTILAYRIAEHQNIMTPVMVNLDGFVLTHTYENVFIPNQELVDEFLPKIDMKENKMDIDNPTSLCITAGNDHNLEFKLKQDMDLINSIEIIEKLEVEFSNKFGRNYGGMIESYMTEDAEYVLITTGSVSGTTRIVVDKLRKEGKKVGMVKLRYVRPFPTVKLFEALKNVKAYGVIDKNVSFGFEGTIFTNVNSSIHSSGLTQKGLNFIGGLGGRDITKENIQNCFEDLFDYSNGIEKNKVTYMNVRCEI